jgi:Phosphodiester glycosidase
MRSALLTIGVAVVLTLPLTSAHAMPAGPSAIPYADLARATGGTTIAERGVTKIAPGLTYRELTRRGPVVSQILHANLTESTLHPAYLYSGTVTRKARLTRHARRAGAVAGVNGDFFDIGATNAPLGVGLTSGQLINAPATGWNRAVGFDTDGPGTRAQLARIRLAGTVRLPTGATLDATNLNSPRLAKGGVAIYTPRWGTEDRSQVVRAPRLRQFRAQIERSGESVRLPRDRDGGTRARAAAFEVVLDDGVVTRRRSDPGGAVAAGTRVLLGVGAAAKSLAGLRVGDRVDVGYRPASSVDAEVAITGNVILLHGGSVVAPPSERQPRTAIGISADGTRVWLVTVDGRSDKSVGMTYVRLAKLLKSLGAKYALNLDGGGSTTMVARMPGDDTVSVRNTPSDGAQRPVPNGIGFVTTARRGH